MAALLPFPTPLIKPNPTGFGPSDYPARFVGVPFNPFTKSDRLGRFMGARSDGLDKRKDAGDDYELVDTKVTAANRAPRLSARRGRGGFGGNRGGYGGNRGGYGGNRGGRGGNRGNNTWCARAVCPARGG